MAASRRWASGAIIGLLTAFLLTAGVGPAAAAPSQDPAVGQLMRVDSQGPVDIRADRVIYEEASKTYAAEGEVEVVRGPVKLFADRVRLHSEKLVAEAEGRVRMESGGEVLTGQRMLIDMQGGTGKIYDGQIFIKSNNFYLRGQEIDKVGKESYHLGQGSFTSCDGVSPPWNITGKDIDVDLDGFGTINGAAFRIKDMPVLYAPWATFPAKYRRQSGLLPPMMGMSDRDGVIYSQPWFQTLGDDHDATFTLNFMSFRGLDYGLEYRYALSPGSKGMMALDYMPDDGMGQELKDKFKNVEAYHSRYWFRMKNDQRLFNDQMNIKMDVDLVSDQDYLKEFTFGHTGFEATNQRFIEGFGREVDPRTSTWRQNKINLQRYWSSTTFNGSLIYNDDLVTDNKRTQQQLPYLTFDATRQAVGETGWYFQMGSSYNYYYQQEGAKGHISDVAPTFALPLNFNDYLSLEPSFSYRQRLYSVDRDSATDTAGSTTGTSELWSFNTQASTYLYRVFEFGSAEDPLKLKHAFRPNLTYSYQPNIPDDDMPLLARQNQNQQRVNQVSYGIQNALTSKSISKDDQTGEVRPIYREFLNYNLSHAFNLNDYRNDPTSGSDDPQYWGNIGQRLILYPSKYLYLEGDTSWNLYKSRWDQINALLKTRNRRGDAITVDYRFTADNVKQVRGKLTLAVTKEWSVSYTGHKDLSDYNTFQSIFELAYLGQCWGIRTYYVDDLVNRGYYLAFSLGGFGELLGWGQIRSVSNSTY
ncbi:MAG: LPS-assembly protein LptD [Desulfarculus sp.]|nr:LPS-assembly protein LptD [Desulfarculus sp.]